MTTLQGSGGKRQPEPEFLLAARVLRPWGMQGEMKLDVLISNPQDIAQSERVFLGEDRQPYAVESARMHQGSLMIKLAGCDTPEQVDKLRGLSVHIARADLSPLQPNQYYHYQILGLEVVTVDGDVLGRVTEIIETGANDVYVVQGPRGEVLIPARREFINRVDLDAGRMTVTLLPGMLPE
jgi:16S rRNA processing protein RimM